MNTVTSEPHIVYIIYWKFKLSLFSNIPVNRPNVSFIIDITDVNIARRSYKVLFHLLVQKTKHFM